MTSSPSLTTAPSLFLGRAGLGGRFAARPQGALGTGGTINWGIFKRHFWGELLRHPQSPSSAPSHDRLTPLASKPRSSHDRLTPLASKPRSSTDPGDGAGLSRRDSGLGPGALVAAFFVTVIEEP